MDQNNTKYYFDYLKRTEKFPNSVYHKAKHNAVFKLLHSYEPGVKVLDAGCGIGQITGKYCKQYNITGIDEQSSAIEYCRRNYSGKYIKADLYDIPLEDNLFDVILFLDSIEHFTKPVLALKELHRVLKPGGKILICTINYSNPLWLILENTWHRFFAGNCKSYQKDVHPTRYTAKLLRKHCQGLFNEVYFEKRILKMELFYLGQKVQV